MSSKKNELAQIFPENFKWEPHTLYLASISWFVGNPPHDVIIYSGFLSDSGFQTGHPAGHHQAWCVGSEAKEFMYDGRVVIHIKKKLGKKETTGEIKLCP